MRKTSSLWAALCLVLLSCQTKVDLDTVIMEGEDTAVCWMTGLADDTPVASWHPGMTLADLRGKILVLSRNRYDGGPMGAYIEGWTSGTDAGAQRGATLVDASGSRSPVWVQDYYKPAGADDKWTEIRDLLDAASTAADPSPLVVNHVSGYIGKLPDYRANAQNVNGKAAEYIRSMNGPVGIVMMDFAGVSMSAGKKVSGKELVEALIGNQ